MGSEEPTHFAQYLLQTISRGGNPSTYIMGIPGKIPYTNLDIAARITRFHRDWKDIYAGMRPIAKTGLIAPDEALMNSSQYEDALSEFQGLYTAMQELHIPFDVIEVARIAATAENGGLKRYEVLILPNIGELDSKDAQSLDDWVAAGGHLVGTGSSGITEDGTAQLRALPSSRQRDIITEREKLWSTYFAPPQNRTEENYYTGPIVPVYGTYHLFDWKEDTKGIYKLLAFAPFAPPEYAYGNVQIDDFGCGVGAFEGGKGIAIPFAVGRGYRELGLSVFRDFFHMILRDEGAATEKLKFNIAEQVEVTLNINGPRTVVHLINTSGQRKQNVGEWLPIPAGTIEVEGKNVTAYALVSNSTLKIKDGKILLPGLDLFEVVVIDGLQ